MARKRIGILTGRGDAPGLNAQCLRSTIAANSLHDVTVGCALP